MVLNPNQPIMDNYAPDVKWVTCLLPERINPSRSVLNKNLLEYKAWTFWLSERREVGKMLVRYEVTCQNREVMADVHAWLSAKFPVADYKMLWVKPMVNSDGHYVLKAYRVLGHHLEEHLENVRKRNEAEERRKRLKLVGGTDGDPNLQSIG